MKKLFANLSICGAFFFGLQSTLAIAETNTYKWIDEKGVVHYGDRVPPEYSQQRREELNKHGMTVSVTNAPKTREQLAEDARKARIEAEERRKQEEQMTRDRVLLTSYSSDKDMETVYTGKIDAIAGIIRLTETNINLTRQSLKNDEAEVAENELSGKAISGDLRKRIASERSLIAKNQAYIDTKRKEQADLHAQFEIDLKRYRELKKLPETEENHPVKDTFVTVKENITDKSSTKNKKLVTVECSDTPSCVKAWSMAKLYIQAKANTRLQETTDIRLLTSEPTRPNAIGLSVTRIPNQKGELLQMEVLCHNSPDGEKYCLTPQVQAIRDGFKSYVEGN
ncbi:putative DUF4124 domain-containing protein [Gammaproteobacteria bacterium]